MQSNPSILGGGTIPPGLIEGMKKFRETMKEAFESIKDLFAKFMERLKISMHERKLRKQASSVSTLIKPKTNATPRATILRPNRAKALNHYSRRHRHSELCWN